MRIVYEREVGVVLAVGIPPASEHDLTGATLKAVLTRPDRSVMHVPCVLNQAVPEQRYVTYTTRPGDLAVTGRYTVYVTFKYEDRREFVAEPLQFDVWPRGRGGSVTTVSS